MAEIVYIATGFNVTSCALSLHPFLLLAKDFDRGSAGRLHSVSSRLAEGHCTADQRGDEGANGQGVHVFFNRACNKVTRVRDVKGDDDDDVSGSAFWRTKRADAGRASPDARISI